MEKRRTFRPTAPESLEGRVVLSPGAARLAVHAPDLSRLAERQAAAVDPLLMARRADLVQTQQTAGPTLLDPNLTVRRAIRQARRSEPLESPIGMAFVGRNAFLVAEKNTGKVKLFANGNFVRTVLDLPVNFGDPLFSERGLLGIAVHANFPRDRGVYLYWTESSTGQDTINTLDTPLLGNRVDRYVLRRGRLEFDRNIIRLRSLQNDGAPLPPPNPAQGDEGQLPFGNHNGGVIRFGPDGKLYVVIGDQGRRGLLQNLLLGPTPPLPDDQFGGPQPDNEHLSGVILRLNDDGSAPADNPFFNHGQQLINSGQQVVAGRNLQKVFAYGVRNSFGLAFDPRTGALWESENGDDAFDEINRIEPGHNGGWIQTMGPLARQAQFKAIELSTPLPPPLTAIPPAVGGLQQLRHPPTRLPNTPAEARARLVNLPGSHYSDPQFSWRYKVGPAGIGFLNGRRLGRGYDGDLFMGAARPFLGGYLFRFDLSADRREIEPSDPRLADRVADNNFATPMSIDPTESGSLLFGTGFGIVTDILTGPDGNLYAVSLTNGEPPFTTGGAIYVVGRARGGFRGR